METQHKESLPSQHQGPYTQPSLGHIIDLYNWDIYISIYIYYASHV